MSGIRRYLTRWRADLAYGLGATFCVGAILWTGGLLHFADTIPEAVIDPDSRTDAIVVLTGGSERLSTGLRLLAESKASRVFVTGVDKDVELRQVLDSVGEPWQQLGSRIEAGHAARDTAGNAVETAAWMRENNLHSLRLVTASYHMPRSLLEFQSALPDAKVIPHPVFPDHVKQDGWWKWPGTTVLIIGEYNKFLLAWGEQQMARLWSSSDT